MIVRMHTNCTPQQNIIVSICTLHTSILAAVYHVNTGYATVRWSSSSTRAPWWTTGRSIYSSQMLFLPPKQQLSKQLNLHLISPHCICLPAIIFCNKWSLIQTTSLLVSDLPVYVWRHHVPFNMSIIISHTDICSAEFNHTSFITFHFVMFYTCTHK